MTGYPSIDKPWLKYFDSDFLQQPVPKMNIYSYLRQMTASYQTNPALTFYGKKIGYKELFFHIDEAAKVLSQIGVQPGDRVLYLMPNIPETTYFMYGGARIGAVADYIDPRPDSVDFKVSAQKVLTLFIEEKCKFIVSLDQCYLAMLQPIEEELRAAGLHEIILVSADNSMDHGAKMRYLLELGEFNGFHSLVLSVKKTKLIQNKLTEAKRETKVKLLDYSNLVKESSSAILPPIVYAPEQLAVIVHTSGTSSAMPKPIPLSHDNLNFYAHQTIGANMPMAAGDRVLHILPFFAAFGIVDVVHSGLCHANNLIGIPEFSAANLGKLIAKYKPQTVIGTPNWFLAMLQDPALKKADLSFLTMATYGGDAMEASDENAVNEFFASRNARCKLTKGHGMSETCGCGSFALGNYNVPASVGIPMPLTTYAIVDPDTKELLHFEEDQEYLEGELIISSGAVTSGELDGKVIVPHADYNGESYIFTRDIARMDKNGVMYFLSRSDRSITRFDGYKIKPYEVENIIKEYPDVAYCIVSPVYDKTKFGFLAIADIVLNTREIPARDAQIQIVKKLIEQQFIHNANVSSRQIPAWFRIRESMPFTANNKVNYNALAKEALTGREIQVLIEETNISINQIIVK